MPDYKKLVFTPPPEAPNPVEEGTSVEQAIRNVLGGGVRITSGLLANEGGPIGAAISGGGDYLAQAIERGKGTKLLELNPMNMNKGELAAETAIGAVPLGLFIKHGKALRSGLMTAGILGASTEARKYVQDDPSDTGGRTGVDALVKPNGKVGLTNPLDWNALDKAAVLGGAGLAAAAGHFTMPQAEKDFRAAKKTSESEAAKAAAEANVSAPKYGEVHPTKKVADAAAAKMNAEGNEARVIPHEKGYQVIPADFKADQLAKAEAAKQAQDELNKLNSTLETGEQTVTETITPAGKKITARRKRVPKAVAERMKEQQQDKIWENNVKDLNAKGEIDKNAERLRKLEDAKEGKDVVKGPVVERTNAKNELGEDVSQSTTFREPPLDEDGDVLDVAPPPPPKPKSPWRTYVTEDEALKVAGENDGVVIPDKKGFAVIPKKRADQIEMNKRGRMPISQSTTPIDPKSVGVDIPKAEQAANFDKANKAAQKGRPKKGAAPIVPKPATPDVNAEAAAREAFNAAPPVNDIPTDELAQRAKWTGEGPPPDDLPPTPPPAPTPAPKGPKPKGPKGGKGAAPIVLKGKKLTPEQQAIRDAEEKAAFEAAGGEEGRKARLNALDEFLSGEAETPLGTPPTIAPKKGAKAPTPLKDSEKGIVFEPRSPEENAARFTPEVKAELQKMAEELGQPNDGRLFKQLPAHRQIQEATPMAPAKNGKLAKMSSEINQQKAAQYLKEVMEGNVNSRHHEGVLAAAEGRVAKNAANAAEDARLADVLDTGEAQPRLPEAGAVREVENATPQVAEDKFSLSSEAASSKPQASGDLLAGAESDAEKLARLKKDLANPELARYHNTMKRQVQYLEQQMTKKAAVTPQAPPMAVETTLPKAEAAAKGKAPAKQTPPVDYREAFKNAKKNLKRVGASDEEINQIIAQHPNDPAAQIAAMKAAHGERWEPLVNKASGAADELSDPELITNKIDVASDDIKNLNKKADKLGRVYRQYQDEFKAGQRPEIEARAAGYEANRVNKALNEQANAETLVANRDMIERWAAEDAAKPTGEVSPQPKGKRGAAPARKRNNESGQANPLLLARVGMGGLGAAVGASEDEEHPLRGALLGGTLGAAAPSIGAAFSNGSFNKVGQKLNSIGRLIPDAQRFNLLAEPVGLGANTFAGPIGSAFMGALEKAVQGDPRGLAVIKDLATTYNWPKNFWANLVSGRAKDAIGAAERAEKSVAEAKTPTERFLALPGEVMTAGDQAARDILMKHGFSLEDARRMTLTMDPKSAIGKGIANIFKARTEGGLSSTFLKTMLPFKRTAANIVEQGLERTPFIGYAMQAKGKDAIDRDPMMAQHAQQATGAGVLMLAYQIGKRTDPANDKMVRKFISNFAGPYSMLASAGFAAGQAAAKEKPFGRQLSAGTSSAFGDMPLPTTRTPLEIGESIIKLLEGQPLHPQKSGPGRYLPRAAYPGVLDKMSDPDYRDVISRLVNGTEE